MAHYIHFVIDYAELEAKIGREELKPQFNGSSKFIDEVHLKTMLHFGKSRISPGFGGFGSSAFYVTAKRKVDIDEVIKFVESCNEHIRHHNTVSI